MPKRTLLLALTLTVITLAATGCSDNSSPAGPQPSARIRLVHASVDLGPVDVYLGTAAMPWLEDLTYLQTSTYNTDSPRAVTLVFRTAGSVATSTPLFTSTGIDLISGSSVSAMALGLMASTDPDDMFRLSVYADSWTAHGTNESRVRIINGSPDAPTVTVAISGGATLATDLARWADSGLGGVSYPAGDEQTVVVSGPAGEPTFLVPALDLGQDYYFVLTGLVASAGADAFTLLPVGPAGSIILVDPFQRVGENRLWD